MEIVENENPCRKTALLQLSLGLLGATVGLCVGVMSAAKMLGRKVPPVR